MNRNYTNFIIASVLFCWRRWEGVAEDPKIAG